MGYVLLVTGMHKCSERCGAASNAAAREEGKIGETSDQREKRVGKWRIKRKAKGWNRP
jgi:hypothetical protein